MLSTRQKIWRSVILILVAIGFIRLLIHYTANVLGMVAVIALIGYLYRRPPRWLIRLSHPQTTSSASFTRRKPRTSVGKSKKRERQKRRFRVIEGKGNRPFKKTKMP